MRLTIDKLHNKALHLKQLMTKLSFKLYIQKVYYLVKIWLTLTINKLFI